MGQFNKTVKILEGARNKLIDMRDNWFPVGSSFSMELDEFVMDKIDDILEQTEVLGEILEKAMGKKRFDKALKKIQEKNPPL